jgi:hypothetical protein
VSVCVSECEGEKDICREKKKKKKKNECLCL